jgi:O-antigen ligase
MKHGYRACPKRLTLSQALVFATTLYIFTVVAFSHRPEIFWLSNIAGYLLAIVFISNIILKTNPIIALPTPLICAIIFFFFMTASIIWAPFPTTTRVISFLQILILSIIIVSVVRKPDGIEYVFYGVMLGLIYAGIHLFLNFSTAVLQPGERLGSTLGNPNTYAFALLVGVILISYKIITLQKKTFRKLFFLLSGLLFFSYQILIITGSRKGFILLFLFLGFLSIKKTMRLSLVKKVLIGIVFLSGVAFLFWWVQDLPIFQRILNIGLYVQGEKIGEHSLGLRVLMASTGFELFFQRPLLGWGAQQYQYISGFGSYSHSNYIELLVNHGLIGLGIYYTLFASLLRRAWRLKKKASTETSLSISYWLFAAIVFLLIWDVAAVSYYNKLYWILLATLTGFASLPRRIVSA